MKTAIVILSVLAVTAVVYGVDPAAIQKFKNDYAQCAQMLGVPNEPRIDVALCSAIRDGEVLSPNGEYNKEAIQIRLEALISDPSKLQQARKIFEKCDQANQKGAIGILKTMQLITCCLPILSLLD